MLTAWCMKYHCHWYIISPTVKKHNWFIAGGFSSYLMKKETYGLLYENAWGQPQYYKPYL